MEMEPEKLINNDDYFELRRVTNPIGSNKTRFLQQAF
jgi:hypothetical protein